MRFWSRVEVAAVPGKTRATRQAAMAVVAALVVTQKRCLTLSREPIQSTPLSLEMVAHLWRQQHRGVLLGSKGKQAGQLLRLVQLRKVAKRAARTWLALPVVPAVVEAKALLLPMHREMEAATEVMVLRHKAVLAPDRAQRPASSENLRASFTLAAVVAAVVALPSLLQTAGTDVTAAGMVAAQQTDKMQRQIPVAVAAVLQAGTTKVFLPVLADPASCASACIRRARKRGKDNHAVIQERNEDGGSKSTAL